MSNGLNGHCLNFMRRSNSSFHHEHLIPILRRCTSVQEQLEKMYNALCLTSEDFENRMEVCKTVENVLKPFFPKCNVHLVGSSVNGLGMKGCDVDMSFVSDDDALDQVSSSEYALVPSIEDVKSGQFPLKNLCCLPTKVQLLFIKNVLDKHCPECVNVEYVAGRCRIISFLYEKHNLKCDLSFNTRSALYSTKLFHLYGQLDKRVPLLLTFFKYWTKRCRLVGGPVRFKTYAFCLLMIYFLQTRTPPVIPNVEHLFSKTDFLMSDAPWDYGASPDVGKFEPSRNTQSAEDLLREFFFFYAFFDFYKAICPLSATCVDQKLLTFREEQEGGLNHNVICIEDPLDVSWNVTCHLQFKVAKSFMENLVAVCKLYQSEALFPSHSDNWGLIQMLNREIVSDASLIYGPVAIQIPSTLQCAFHLQKESGITVSHDGKDQWIQRVLQAVLKTLEYGFLFKCTVLSTKNQLCHEKFSEHHYLRKYGSASGQFQTVSCDEDKMQDVVKSQSNDNVILHLHCVAPNIWQGREECRKQLYPCDSIHKNLLEREHSISCKVSEWNQGCDIREFAFFCECSETVCSERTVLNITLRPTVGKKFLPKLGILLKEYIPFIVNSLM